MYSDYTLKSVVLKNGIYKDYKDIQKAKYAYYRLLKDGLIIKSRFTYDYALQLEEYYHESQPIEYKEAERIYSATRSRNKRLNNYIKKMLNNGDCLFLTFTFNDSTLNTTSKDSRRQIVRRYLSNYKTDYVANIDYGKKNEREHYHAVIQCNKVDYSAYHKYGAIKGEIIKSTSDSIKLAKYINKLTNHAIKDTCKGCRLIYARLPLKHKSFEECLTNYSKKKEKECKVPKKIKQCSFNDTIIQRLDI